MLSKRLIGNGRCVAFENLTPWSRTWVLGANCVAVQSFEWCFDRLSLARSCQFGSNLNPPIATLARVSFHLGELI